MMDKIKEKDLHDVRKLDDLTANDLQNVYAELEISKQDIETAVNEAQTTDFRLRAFHVLLMWRKHEGKLATRQKLLEVFEKCRLKSAKEDLEEMWGLGKQ